MLFGETEGAQAKERLFAAVHFPRGSVTRGKLDRDCFWGSQAWRPVEPVQIQPQSFFFFAKFCIVFAVCIYVFTSVRGAVGAQSSAKARRVASEENDPPWGVQISLMPNKQSCTFWNRANCRCRKRDEQLCFPVGSNDSHLIAITALMSCCYPRLLNHVSLEAKWIE